MNAEEQLEELYKRGFNAGYMLAKYDPELLSKFTKENSPQNVYIKALKAGSIQYEKDLKLEQLKALHEQQKNLKNERER